MSDPVCLYRLQFGPHLDFAGARALLPYLARLGVSHVYASPVFAARPGSAHGYDVIDPTAINPELGGLEGYRELSLAARELGLFLVQDIVPNHMAVSDKNAWLMDVLESGEKSAYRDFFDVDWNHPYEDIRGRVLMPVLGKTFGESLEAGELQVVCDTTGIGVSGPGFRFPLRLGSWERVLAPAARTLRLALGRESPEHMKTLGLLYALRNLPDVAEAGERRDQTTFAKGLFAEMYGADGRFTAAVDEAVAALNGRQGQPESFDGLEALLAEQHFRLAHWKVATQEINYRRFFNINDLICLRVEDEAVFAASHALILNLVAEGLVQGLRVDHIDGLADPAAYLEHLSRRCPTTRIWVEKILAPDEELPPWPVAGTTGYEFMRLSTGVLCRREGVAALGARYRRFTGRRDRFPELVAEKKKLVVEREMAGDVEDLAHHFKSAAGRDRRGADVTLIGLRQAMLEVLAAFPVYRSYVRLDADGSPQVREADRAAVDRAVALARRRAPGHAAELEFLRRFLLLDGAERLTGEELLSRAHLVMRFQQLSGPLMAKGFEDTALYCYNRFPALNEVGGAPADPPPDAAAFHAAMVARAARGGLPLSATSSHDTKRGEDCRARLAVLSEAPEAWGAALDAVVQALGGLQAETPDGPAPDPNDVWLMLMTVFGAASPGLFKGRAERAGERERFRERVREYLLKAAREAKERTEWIRPDEEYEAALLAYADALLGLAENAPPPELAALFERLDAFGPAGSLAMTLLKLACPGVPEIYQGSEYRNLSLVDPDNRGAVDFRGLAALLEGLPGAEPLDPETAAALLAGPDPYRAKLHCIRRGLAARRAAPELFARGRYLPLAVRGPRAAHVLAFARLPERAEEEGEGSLRPGEPFAVAAVALFPSLLVPGGAGRPWPLPAEAWAGTFVELPPELARARDAFSGRMTEATQGGMAAAELFACFPAALLTGTG